MDTTDRRAEFLVRVNTRRREYGYGDKDASLVLQELDRIKGAISGNPPSALGGVFSIHDCLVAVGYRGNHVEYDFCRTALQELVDEGEVAVEGDKYRIPGTLLAVLDGVDVRTHDNNIVALVQFLEGQIRDLKARRFHV